MAEYRITIEFSEPEAVAQKLLDAVAKLAYEEHCVDGLVAMKRSVPLPPESTPPDRSGRWVDGQLVPFGPRDLDGWQPTHEEAVSGD